MAKKQDLKSLRDLISAAHDILATINLPEQRAERAYELLTAALHLADHLISEKPAAVLGKRGGSATAKRGPDYFRKIAAMRKTHAGGRPPKKPN